MGKAVQNVAADLQVLVGMAVRPVGVETWGRHIRYGADVGAILHPWIYASGTRIIHGLCVDLFFITGWLFLKIDTYAKPSLKLERWSKLLGF